MTDRRALKAWRDLWQHRGRSLLVTLAMALGLGAAGTVLNAWALVRQATGEGFLASQPVSATLVLDRADAQALAIAQGQPGIAAARLRRTLPGAVLAGGRPRPAVLYVLGEPGRTDIARLQPIAGPWPPAAGAGDGAVWMERSSLEFSGAAVGEPLGLRLSGREVTVSLPLAGVLRDVSQAPGWMENLVYLYGTQATLAALGVTDGLRELQLRVTDAQAPRSAVRGIVAQLQARLTAAGYSVRSVDVPEPGEHIHAAQMDSLLMTQGAFGLLALAACGFLVLNLVSAMLAQQVREIAVMKTLGGSPRQLGAMVLGQAAALGLLACALALPLAAGLGRAYGGLKAEMLNFPLDGVALPAWSIALQLAAGLALPLAAAALPVRTALRRPIGEALRDVGLTRADEGLALRRGPVADWLAPRLGGWARPLLLSLGNALRRRQRLVLTVLALASGGAVYLGAANLRAAVRGSVEAVFNAQQFQLQLRLATPAPAAQLEAIAAATEGVAQARAWRSLRSALGPEPVQLIGLPPEGLLAAPPLAGRWSQDGAAELVVTRLLQRQRPELAVGSHHRLAGQDWQVVGLIEGGPQALAYTSRAMLDQLAGDDLASTVVVQLTRPGSAVALLDAARALRTAYAEAGLPVAASQSQADSRRVLEDHLLMVVEFLGAMGVVMIAVGAMGLASTLGLSVLERRREIGVLRALGASDRAILGMIQAEGLVFVVLAWAASLPLSLPISAALQAAFGRIMFSVPWRLVPDATTAFGWLGLMAIMSLLACALPARRALQLPTARALAYA